MPSAWRPATPTRFSFRAFSFLRSCAGKKKEEELYQMSEPHLEEQYKDVLQNIEFGIISVYREHPEMTDWQALDAIQALIRTYQAEARGRQVDSPSLEPLAQQVYNMAGTMCEWRLGREQFASGESDKPLDLPIKPLSLDEITACLKRIRKSIKFWSKRGGRQGYLNYVEQFIV
jgi:hypothetical protein